VLGSVLGAAILSGMFLCSEDQTTNFASNVVNGNYREDKAIFAEFIATALLCYGVTVNMHPRKRIFPNIRQSINQ